MNLDLIRRHHIPIDAFFRYSLVLTYAFPEKILQPFLYPGLTLDTYEGNGFVAIALVQTEGLRPTGLPKFMGRDFFLAGYRIFSRHKTLGGKTLRGLRILRSDADSDLMVWGGNLLTHYGYKRCSVVTQSDAIGIEIQVKTFQAEADVSVRALLQKPAQHPPHGSPFPNLKIARRYAGPLPHTFSYEQKSKQLLIVKGLRSDWNPMPVEIEDVHCSFFNRAPFNQVPLQLANAFYVENIPYSWERGILVPALAGET